MPDSKIQLIDSRTGDIFPAAPDGGVLLSSEDLGWEGITVEYHRIPPLTITEHYIEGHRLAVNIGLPVRYEWKEGAKWRQTLLKPGALCLQTHGDLNFPRWWDDFEFLAIAINPQFLNQAFQGTSALEIEFQDKRGIFDAAVADFSRRFKGELAAGSYCGKLYGESLAVAFALHLIEEYSTRSQKLCTPVGKLTAQQLKQVIEYVHDNLGEELSLIALAEQVNLSAFHFSRLFKSSLGLSPHQYVLQTRLERAKKLITVAAELNLADVSLQVGFYDQAHFTKAFKRLVGLSPKGFFKEVAN